MVLSFLARLKLIGVILSVVLLASTFIISVSSSFVYLIKTGDPKPLLIETGGHLVGQDAIILNSVNELKQENLKKEYTDFLKTRIVSSIVMFVIVIILTYFGIKALFTVGMPKDQMTVWQKGLYVFISIVFITFLGVLYKGIILHVWGNPYAGITELIRNWDVLANVGTETIYKALNNSIGAST